MRYYRDTDQPGEETQEDREAVIQAWEKWKRDHLSEPMTESARAETIAQMPDEQLLNAIREMLNDVYLNALRVILNSSPCAHNVRYAELDDDRCIRYCTRCPAQWGMPK